MTQGGQDADSQSKDRSGYCWASRRVRYDLLYEIGPEASAWLDATIVILIRWYTGRAGPWCENYVAHASQARALRSLGVQVRCALEDETTQLPDGDMNAYLDKKDQ